MFIPRKAEATIRQLLEGYPLVAVTGPRQSGRIARTSVVLPDCRGPVTATAGNWPARRRSVVAAARGIMG